MKANFALQFSLLFSRPCVLNALLSALLVYGLLRYLEDQGLCSGLRRSGSAALAAYLFALLWLLVLGRTGGEMHRAEWRLFWSYRAIAAGRRYLLYLNLSNVLVFIPVGLMLPWAWPKAGFFRALGFGALFSLFGELLQLATGKGLFELDDLFHNTVGTLIGVLLWYGAGGLLQRYWEKRRPPG